MRDVLREVNLRINEMGRQFHFDDAEFICECDRPDCGPARVEMRMTEFADCAAAEGAAIVAPGHQPPEAEVVREGVGWVLVRDTPRDV